MTLPAPLPHPNHPTTTARKVPVNEQLIKVGDAYVVASSVRGVSRGLDFIGETAGSTTVLHLAGGGMATACGIGVDDAALIVNAALAAPAPAPPAPHPAFPHPAMANA